MYFVAIKMAVGRRSGWRIGVSNSVKDETGLFLTCVLAIAPDTLFARRQLPQPETLRRPG